MTSTTARVRAPELSGAGGWINTDRPLSLAALRGRVVLLDFWTFCCINCLRVIEELRLLEERFGDRLVVIGVHSPKFPHEQDLPPSSGRCAATASSTPCSTTRICAPGRRTACAHGRPWW